MIGFPLLSVDIKGHSSLRQGNGILGLLTGVAAHGRYLGFTRYFADDSAAELNRRLIADHAFARKLMLVISAGPTAEACVLRDESTQRGYDEDGEKVYNLAAIACGFGSLESNGQIRISDPKNGLPQVQAMAGDCFARTETLLRDNWPSIKAVAMALLARKSLTGEEVAEIVWSHAVVA